MLSTLRRRKKQLGGRQSASSLSSPIIGSLISRFFAIGAVVYFLSMLLLVAHLPLPDSSFNDGRHHMLLFESEEESSEAAAASAAVSSSAYSEKGHEVGGGASACLLVNDENPNLPEWIAYHYQTLPLRSLIVAVDPASRSSPSEILSRWNNSRLLDVQLWNDDDYLYETITTRQLDGTEVTKTKKRIVVSRDIQGHRTRQNNFIVKCMAEFKRRNKTWVLLIDVDEYITFNRITNDNDDNEEDDEPNYPLEKAPEGIPTLMNWVVEKVY